MTRESRPLSRAEELHDIHEQQEEHNRAMRQEARHAAEEYQDAHGGRMIGGRWYDDAEIPSEDEL